MFCGNRVTPTGLHTGSSCVLPWVGSTTRTMAVSGYCSGSDGCICVPKSRELMLKILFEEKRPNIKTVRTLKGHRNYFIPVA